MTRNCTPWLAADLERLKALGESGTMTWKQIAGHFPGRTQDACTQQFFLMRRRASGVAPKPRPPRASEARANGKRLAQATEGYQRPLLPHEMPQHKNPFAAAMGDPLPGRSALDQKRGPSHG